MKKIIVVMTVLGFVFSANAQNISKMKMSVKHFWSKRDGKALSLVRFAIVCIFIEPTEVISVLIKNVIKSFQSLARLCMKIQNYHCV